MLNFIWPPCNKDYLEMYECKLNDIFGNLKVVKLLLGSLYLVSWSTLLWKSHKGIITSETLYIGICMYKY